MEKSIYQASDAPLKINCFKNESLFTNEGFSVDALSQEMKPVITQKHELENRGE